MKKKHPAATKKQLREFGVVVGAILALVFGLGIPLVKGAQIHPRVVAVGVILVALGLAAPMALRLPHRIWMFAGEILGWINSRVILSVVFFLIVLPLGLFKKRKHKEAPGSASYRVPVSPRDPQTMNRLY